MLIRSLSCAKYSASAHREPYLCLSRRHRTTLASWISWAVSTRYKPRVAFSPACRAPCAYPLGCAKSKDFQFRPSGKAMLISMNLRVLGIFQHELHVRLDLLRDLRQKASNNIVRASEGSPASLCCLITVSKQTMMSCSNSSARVIDCSPRFRKFT